MYKVTFSKSVKCKGQYFNVGDSIIVNEKELSTLQEQGVVSSYDLEEKPKRQAKSQPKEGE